METTSVWRNAVTGGLILGVALILTSVIDYSMGLYGKSIWLKVFSFLILATGIVYFTVQYRDKVCGGRLLYPSSLGFGVLVSVIASCISAIFMLVLIKFIDPAYHEQLIQVAIDEAASKVSGAQLDTAEKMIRVMMNPLIIFAITLLTGAFIGLVVSAITSIFTQKKQGVLSKNSFNISRLSRTKD